ncbi:Glycosyltransferase involved in cell wall bisynthesis [Cohaesibacter sp. ES.047]|nr:Glycosyltransferase involved in cell wall bisynthesis [Cohaesibacter sp. ES.047]
MFATRKQRQRRHEQLAQAHCLSPMFDRPLVEFKNEIDRLKSGTNRIINFDEDFYCNAYPDIKKAVERGEFECGYMHYLLFGQHEVRVTSTIDFRKRFGIAPSYPSTSSLFYPINAHAPRHYETNLMRLPQPDKRELTIFIPYLDASLFYAGYSIFFKDIAKIFGDFEKINVLVLESARNPELLTEFGSQLNILHYREALKITHAPTMAICFDTETFFMALEMLGGDASKIVYYCQDYEAGFFPFGTQYIRCEKALLKSENIIISTPFLRDFLERQGLLNAKRIYVKSPEISPFPVKMEKSKKIFCYFRPEFFNSRNLPEIILEAINAFSARHNGYEFYLVGTVEVSYSFEANGSKVYVLNKLPKDEYINLIGSCDAVVSMIYSAHPGVIAWQSAASGIPTVTNCFLQRDKDTIEKISKNIVVYDPYRDELADKMELALQMDKGDADFNREFYENKEPKDIRSFLLDITSE